MRSRPQIPKKLAARLRSVYVKLAQSRTCIAHVEAEIIDALMHLQVYEESPELFARMYYPSVRDGVESYPVQTNTERTRGKLEHFQRRMPAYLQEVADAEAAARKADQQVLDELAAIKRDTPGRVAWPKSPQSLDELRRLKLKERKRSRQRYREFVETRHRQNIARAERDKVNDAQFLREVDAQVEANLLRMPVAQAIAYRTLYESLRRSIDADSFGLSELLALAAGNRSVLSPVLDSAKAAVEVKYDIRL